MRALITGASGFIGRNLTRELLSSSWTVSALTRNSSDLRPLEDEIGDLKRIDVIEVPDDIATCSSLVGKIGPDAVFHLAAMGSADHEASQVDQLIDVNIRLGVWLLESLRELHASQSSKDVAPFVAAGSFWQHHGGSPRFEPTSLYAATKQAFEDLMCFYRDVEGLPCVMLKLFDVYGPRDTRGRLMNLLLGAAKSGDALALSPGDQFIDLVHVDDVARAFISAANTLRKHPGRLKLAHTVPACESLPLKDLVAQISDMLGQEIPVDWGGRPYRPREVMQPWRGDPLPGWSAEIELSEGLKSLFGAD